MLRAFILSGLFLGIAQAALAQDFQVGQTWQYETRAREPNSTLHIYRIDDIDGVQIYSIAVSNITIAAVKPGNEVTIVTELPHVPVTVETLQASVTQLVSNAPAPEIGPEGYDYWREELAAGNAGWWNHPLDEIIAIVETELQRSDQFEAPILDPDALQEPQPDQESAGS